MIFQINKSKNDPLKTTPTRPVENETIQRWREMSVSRNGTEDPAETVAEAPAWHESNQPIAWLKEEHIAPKVEPVAAPITRPQAIRATVSEPKEEVRSALGPGTVIEGKLRFDSPVRIDGSLIGEVTSSSVLIVGEQAVVKAIVNVGSLVVHGQVSGQVEAHEKVEIKDGGCLEANIKTKQLIIDEGGFFRGGCNTQ